MMNDDTLPPALAGMLLEGLREAPPAEGRAAAMKTRLFERVHRGAAAGRGAELITVRAGDGWQELMPRIFAKRVYTDGWAETYLVRLEPGCCAPPHVHPADEECAVLEGELTIGDIHLRAGDFHIGHRGSSHGATTTATGALVMLRYAAPLSQFMSL